MHWRPGTRHLKRLALPGAGLLAAGGLLAGACGSDSTPTAAPTTVTTTVTASSTPSVTTTPSVVPTTPSTVPTVTVTVPGAAATVEATDQTGDGTSVTVASVTLPNGGFMVIHSDQAGAPGPVIGHSDLLPSGTSSNVVVKLDTPLTGSATVWPMAHIDDGDGKYTFPGPDVPALQADGQIAMVSISYTVEGAPTGTPTASATPSSTPSSTPTTSPTATPSAPAGAAAVEADDQQGDGKTVVVKSVTLPNGGFVVIHSDQNGAPGPVIGHSDLLDPGTSNDVEVKLEKPLKKTATVWPMAHIDDGDGKYTFPGPDVPALGADGQIAMVSIKYTVGGGGNATTLEISTPSGIQFDKQELDVKAGAQVTVKFTNNAQGIPHNIHFFASADASGDTLGKSDPTAGPAVETVEFTAPTTPGDYHFQCDVHPGDMFGVLKVS